MSARMSTGFMLAAVAALVAGLPTDGWSQGTGTITGVVRDGQSLAPVSGAQVHIPELRIGVLAQANGRYLLVNVPVGTHVVQLEQLGYRSESRTITVTAGEAVQLDFDLTQDALALDEIVVTGTAGQARRREVGNSIAQISVDQIEEPVTSLGQLLQGRVAGAQIVEGSGNSGSAADIRLRGNVSMTMSTQPLIYVDGVRVKSEPYLATTGANDPVGPLNDLNPDDIARIEIVKGPAATTLYGTEAAAGVIQVFTKSGGTGAPLWTAELQQGFSYFRPFGTDEVPYMFLDPVFRKGHRQRYAMSVRGGASDRLGYFLSGAYDDNKGAVETDSEAQFALRGNMQFRPHDDVLIQFNNSLTNTELSHVRQGNTISGIVMTAIRGPQSYMGDREPSTLRTLLTESNRTYIDRIISGLTVNYTPASNFTHRLTLGYDFSQFDVERIQPYCWRCSLGRLGDIGSVSRISSQNVLQSMDYVGTLRFDVLSGLGSTLSFGFQGLENELETIEATGDDFPGPGDYTVSSTARRDGSQDKIRVITGGFFLQNMFDLSDRYFLTLGLRVDGNSAFGKSLGLEPYPKVSMSYVLSDESFWPEELGQMKLRAAYGRAGRAPGAFDAVRTWDPVGWGTEQSAFEPQNLGNDELGPERTKEYEVGFDASTLGGRLSANVTYYHQTTEDALFEVARPSTEGGWNAQLENVGEIRNSGIEVDLNGTVLDFSSLRWDLGIGIATNGSEIVSLGGSPPFSVGENGWVIEGQPAPVIRGYKILNYWEKAEPVISEADAIYGPAYPTQTFNFNTSFTLPGGITLSGRGQYNGGFYINNYFESGALVRNIEHPKCYAAYEKAASGMESELYAWERAQCFGMDDSDLVIGPGDYFELRGLTLNIPVSRLLPSLTPGATRTDLTISGRNVWLWRNERLVTGHPEQNEAGSNTRHDLVKGIDEQLPPQSYFTVSFRVAF